MTAIISVPNVVGLIVHLIHAARSALLGLGRSLKAKDIKVKDPLPRPHPSDSAVPSAQPVVAFGDDVDRRIARLGQELSTSFTRQFDDLSSFLHTSFNQLRMLLPKLPLTMLLFQLLRRFPLAAVSPPPCSN